ncbi:MAG TPA: hypothetical protein VF802_06465 [Candidatus Limnocylindrales bacterium]
MPAIARHLATVLVIALACPIALLAGVNISCSAGGMTAQCANNGLLLSPLILFIAGAISALLERRAIGFVLGAIGIVLGMTLLWIIVAVVRGIFLPLDPVQALIATVWFGIPPIVGWAVARGAVWTWERLVARPA